MHNILVTGGAGFIGSNFIRFILEQNKNVHVVNLDALTYAGNLENIKDLPCTGRYDFIQGDICDQELMLKLVENYTIDTVVHFAAETHVDRSILGPGAFIQTNVVGTYTLLEAVRRCWKQPYSKAEVRFHHVSTDEVFGSLGVEDAPWKENAAYAPNSPYAASKAASDHLVRSYGHTFGLPYSITNCSNNYGPCQFPEKLIPLMIFNALQGKPLPVYGDGGQVRDWLFVTDHCRAIYEVLTHDESAETYNVGGGNQPTNLEVVNTLCRVMDELLPKSPYCPHHQLIQFVKDRPGHDRRYAMDAGKIQRNLGWVPRVQLEEGLKQTVIWYLENTSWMENLGEKQTFREWLNKNYKER